MGRSPMNRRLFRHNYRRQTPALHISDVIAPTLLLDVIDNLFPFVYIFFLSDNRRYRQLLDKEYFGTVKNSSESFKLEKPRYFFERMRLPDS